MRLFFLMRNACLTEKSVQGWPLDSQYFAMIHISGLLGFHHCVNWLESARSYTILTSICISCVLISFMMCDPSRKRRKFLRNLEKFPGPRRLPFVGNAPHLMFPPDEIFSWLENVNKTWGDVVRFWVFGTPKVFVNSYDVAMQLLSRKTFLLKSEEFEPLKPVGGHSLAGATPDWHTHHRKLLVPGFSRQSVEESMEICCRHSRKLRDSLMLFANDGTAFNVMDYISVCAYKISLETAVGHEVFQDFWDSDCKQQIQAWHTLLCHLVNRSFQPWLKRDFVFRRTAAGKQVLKCYQKINDFSETLNFVRRQRWEFLKTNRFLELEAKQQVQPACFLDLLLDLEDKGEMTRDQVLHNLNIFIVAGYDTTGTTLAWVLHLLATHPEIQEKCVQELYQIFQEDPRPGSSSSTASPPAAASPSFDTLPTTFSLIFATSDLAMTTTHLKQMKYLECCIKEALRLYPVLPWLLRRTEEDIELSDGRVIPGGVDVPINSYIIHRDPKRFPEPELFKPERYCTSEEKGGVGHSSLLSFGAGPRICPGMLFAMQELKIILAHLLMAFKWESKEETGEDDGKKCLFHGVLVPANGVNVKISYRNSQ